MPTANTYIGPQDGWVKVADPADFLRVSAAPFRHPYYLTAAANTPAASVVGVLVCKHPFEVNVTYTENIYVRVPTPVPDSAANDSRLRIDVFTV